MTSLRSLRARLAAGFAFAVLVTVLLFGSATAIAIWVHDREERRSFGETGEEASVWVGDDMQDAKKLVVAMLLVSPIAVAGAAMFGLWLAGRALAPMHEAADRARHALAGEGDLELPVRGIGDEWDELALVTNDILRAKSDAAVRARAFSANAAHELRTPLTAMLGEVQVALRRPRDPGDYRAALVVVEEEIRRLSRLVEMLLALARADAGTLNPSSVRFDLARAARLAAERAVGAHAGADGRVTVRAAAASAQGDPLLTGRVLDNLLDNALRHGGPHVEVSVEETGGRAQVAVRDDGPGIPAALRGRIFERFTREEKPSIGFGLGLAIARGLAEAQRGKLWLDESAPGTRFVLQLPIAPDGDARRMV
ncbi:MAG TPA: HAMP domain-containing sensor histidine kinase [Anaeromyxobacteraceae bacterium]|nr:HAMP domain-containing sensor histidine kinase [Anaeromyxobacteraceae bacterium]